MKLSIITPVYNVEKYLEKCLDSLLTQGLNSDDYEIIVVNDGSTDSSLQIAERYKSIHDNIIVLSQKNQGISVARNSGLSIARGKYIYFIDPDDYLLHNSLARLLDIAIINDADVVSFKSKEVKETYDEKILDFKEPKDAFISSPMTGIAVDKKNLLPIFMTAWFFFVKRDLLNSLNLSFIPKLRYCEDTPYSLTIFMEAKRVVVTNFCVHRYLIREFSTLRDKDPNHKRQMIDCYMRVSFIVNDINEKYHSKRSEKGYIRDKSRISIWVLFSLLNMLRLKENPSCISNNISRLRRSNLYPIGDICSDFGYHGMKFKTVKWVCNQKWLLLVTSAFYTLFKIKC